MGCLVGFGHVDDGDGDCSGPVAGVVECVLDGLAYSTADGDGSVVCCGAEVGDDIDLVVVPGEV